MTAPSLDVQLARKTAALVVHPGEYHGVGTPSYIKDLFERHLAWFGTYVKGVEGIGSASPAEDVTGESPEACRTALSVKQLGWLRGRDPRDLEELSRELEQSHRKAPAARAAVDMALHDLRGRIEGVPLVDLLGRCLRSCAESSPPTRACTARKLLAIWPKTLQRAAFSTSS